MALSTSLEFVKKHPPMPNVMAQLTSLVSAKKPLKSLRKKRKRPLAMEPLTFSESAWKTKKRPLQIAMVLTISSAFVLRMRKLKLLQLKLLNLNLLNQTTLVPPPEQLMMVMPKSELI